MFRNIAWILWDFLHHMCFIALICYVRLRLSRTLGLMTVLEHEMDTWSLISSLYQDRFASEKQSGEEDMSIDAYVREHWQSRLVILEWSLSVNGINKTVCKLWIHNSLGYFQKIIQKKLLLLQCNVQEWNFSVSWII